MRLFDWEQILALKDGETFGVVVDGQHHTAAKVMSKNRYDEEYDNDLEVVIEIDGRYFRKTGWANVGSHCYGEYGPSWNEGLTEVKPKIVPATDWVSV